MVKHLWTGNLTPVAAAFGEDARCLVLAHCLQACPINAPGHVHHCSIVSSQCMLRHPCAPAIVFCITTVLISTVVHAKLEGLGQA